MAVSLDFPHAIPRPEYPRPQFVRDKWLNLNGPWEFAFDDDDVGESQEWHKRPDAPFDRTIIVPFAYQSSLSGIGSKEVHEIVWYRRAFELPDEGRPVRWLLHFGAVDYAAKVWVNGHYIGSHEGGHTPFTFDVTQWVRPGQNTVVVRAEDDMNDLELPRGKQYWKTTSEGIWYTPTTGIWQTVWLEPVSSTHLHSLKMTPDVDRDELHLEVEVMGADDDTQVEVAISFEGHTFIQDTFSVTGAALGPSKTRRIRRSIPINYGGHSFQYAAYWSPDHPHLYDIELKVKSRSGELFDKVTSYFGMRKIHTENGRVYLNNRPLYMRLVLDQGYWPDGILTAPSDEALKKDIELAKEMGFNGARKHQKVEDPRYLYWADKLGFLVWGEMANAYQYSPAYAAKFTREWIEVVERDYNHPSIICWVPINESWGVTNMEGDPRQRDHATAMYYLTKSLDPTRLVISNDGWEHTVSDLLTIHDYDQDHRRFYQRWSDVARAIATIRPGGRRPMWNDLLDRPVLITEYGGVAYKASDWEGWGYAGVDSPEALLNSYANLTGAIYACKEVQGFCYTQLTDVEQEINGLLTFDRRPKVPLEKIREITLGKTGYPVA